MTTIADRINAWAHAANCECDRCEAERHAAAEQRVAKRMLCYELRRVDHRLFWANVEIWTLLEAQRVPGGRRRVQLVRGCRI
jgi:hypothetical protein